MLTGPRKISRLKQLFIDRRKKISTGTRGNSSETLGLNTTFRNISYLLFVGKVSKDLRNARRGNNVFNIVNVGSSPTDPIIHRAHCPLGVVQDISTYTPLTI